MSKSLKADFECVIFRHQFVNNIKMKIYLSSNILLRMYFFNRLKSVCFLIHIILFTTITIWICTNCKLHHHSTFHCKFVLNSTTNCILNFAKILSHQQFYRCKCCTYLRKFYGRQTKPKNRKKAN